MHRNPVGERSLIEKEIVLKGLMQPNKYISSRFLYDKEGSRLFQKIMKMPEYYLYEAEYEILKEKGAEIWQSLSFEQPYCIVELGAGDGSKTVQLLHHMQKDRLFEKYCPVDISPESNLDLVRRLNKSIPDLVVEPVNGNYHVELDHLIPSDQAVLLLFLGSNIGNFRLEKIELLMRKFGKSMKKGDAVLIGMDLKKHPRLIQNAYDDKEGITRDFNLNLLQRFNREMGADFDLDQFDFYSHYDPLSGEVRSYLVSCISQEVYFSDLNATISFDKNELIHTEVSRKFDLNEINRIFSNSGFHDLRFWQDRNEYFVDVLAVRS